MKAYFRVLRCYNSPRWDWFQARQTTRGLPYLVRRILTRRRSEKRR